MCVIVWRLSFDVWICFSQAMCNNINLATVAKKLLMRYDLDEVQCTLSKLVLTNFTSNHQTSLTRLVFKRVPGRDVVKKILLIIEYVILKKTGYRRPFPVGVNSYIVYLAYVTNASLLVSYTRLVRLVLTWLAK